MQCPKSVCTEASVNKYEILFLCTEEALHIMNLQVFLKAASTCSLNVTLVNSDASVLEGNNSAIFSGACP